jgi:hypothetical protein
MQNAALHPGWKTVLYVIPLIWLLIAAALTLDKPLRLLGRRSKLPKPLPDAGKQAKPVLRGSDGRLL